MDIHMDWWDSHQMLPRAYLTDEEHKITVKKESIPIVFVPGIMGSRLKRNGKRVWDPNDTLFTVNTYRTATPQTRQKLLGSPGLEVDEDSSDSFQRGVTSASMKQEAGGFFGMLGFGELPPSMQQDILSTAKARGQDAAAQGWGGVAWNFYGDFLLTLSGQDWKPFSKVFDLPVYAVAYNWTQDNAVSGAYLAGKISEIIAREQSKGKVCEKVIVVSHSMGGLVSRAAAKLSGAEGNIFGMIHGAQPVLGAPAAYRRMRAGFETTWWPQDKIQSAVLGSSSQEVMAVLSHSVGGLELLPNELYKTNHGETQWLKMTKDGITLELLPASDPYKSIYEDQRSFLRLAYHPEYINPASSSSDAVRKSLIEFNKNLIVAKAFHQSLSLQCHGVTYSTWVGQQGLGTWDRIEYRYLRQRMEPFVAYSPEGGATYIDTNPSEGTGTDYWNVHDKSSGYYRIQAQDGKGDGTVPESSGAALKDKSQGVKNKLGSRIVKRVEHSAFFNDGEARDFTVGCVLEMTQKQFKTRMGS